MGAVRVRIPFARAVAESHAAAIVGSAANAPAELLPSLEVLRVLRPSVACSGVVGSGAFSAASTGLGIGMSRICAASNFFNDGQPEPPLQLGEDRLLLHELRLDSLFVQTCACIDGFTEICVVTAN